MAAIPQVPIPAQIEFSSEQIMLGGRPVQNLAADLHADAKSWTIDRLDFRAPGATRVSLSGTTAQAGPSSRFTGALNVESSDPDALVAWLQGRGELTHRSQKPLRLNGDISVTSNRVAIEAMKAEIDGGAVAGRVAVSQQAAGGGSRFDAELKAERLDLDAAAAFARSLAGPQAEWPDEAELVAGYRPLHSAGQGVASVRGEARLQSENDLAGSLKIGRPGSVMLEGTGDFDRVNATGRLALNSSAASAGRITGLIAPFAPAPGVATQCDGAESRAGAPANWRLDLDKNARTRRSRQRRAPCSTSMRRSSGRRRHDYGKACPRGPARVRSRCASGAARSALIETNGGAGQFIACPAGARSRGRSGRRPVLQFKGSATGMWGAPVRLEAKMWGTGLDAEAQGTAEPGAQDAKAGLNLRGSPRQSLRRPVRSQAIGRTCAKNISLSSRVSLAGSRLTLDDLDASTSGSRLRGRLALTLGVSQRLSRGEVGLDALDLAPALALAIGAAGVTIG